MSEIITREVETENKNIVDNLITIQQFFPLAKVGKQVIFYERENTNSRGIPISKLQGDIEDGQIKKGDNSIAKFYALVVNIRPNSIILAIKSTVETPRGYTQNQRAIEIGTKEGLLWFRKVALWERGCLFELLETPKNMPKTIEITIQRKNGKTYLIFTASPEVENIYKKTLKLKERQSKKWDMNFYELPRQLRSQSYEMLLQNHNVIDDYGSEAMQNKKLNIAFLRTVGGTGKVELPDTLNLAEANIAIQNCVSFLKEFFRLYALPYKATGTLTIEI